MNIDSYANESLSGHIINSSSKNIEDIKALLHSQNTIILEKNYYKKIFTMNDVITSLSDPTFTITSDTTFKFIKKFIDDISSDQTQILIEVILERTIS